MPVFKRKGSGTWSYRLMIDKKNGRRVRIAGSAPKHRNTKAEAEKALEKHKERVLHPERAGVVEEEKVMTFHDWFTGRFWREWVVGKRNKPTEVKAKEFTYGKHLKKAFGDVPLNRIGTGEIAEFRASLVEKGLSEKTINNILSILSKPLKYALDVGLISKAPKVGLYKVERPEIEPWEFDEYARMLASARIEGPDWYAAVCLAGEAGLRIGEVKALRWREHVDLIAKTLMIKQQTCYGVTTTPKGRTRRGVPITSTLEQALLALPEPHEGYVVRNPDGSQKKDGQANAVIIRICRRAGLPLKRWHTLRHTFGTHAALCGVNPWSLQAWMGHKRIDETMLYVHVAKDHRRDLPPEVISAAAREADPDRRILRMLGARATSVPWLQSVEDKGLTILPA